MISILSMDSLKTKIQGDAICWSGLNPRWTDIAQELIKVSRMGFVTNTLFK